MATRQQNEKEYGIWETLPDGGRRYWRDRPGIHGFQRIVKIVDADENTVSVTQLIYNEQNELIERHQKYPVDTGHEVLNVPEDKSL